MDMGVYANDRQWKELIESSSAGNCQRLTFTGSWYNEADVLLILQQEAEMDFTTVSKPVILNSVNRTLKKMAPLEKIVRVNGWNSFIKSAKWEMAGEPVSSIIEAVNSLGKELIRVADEPGFVTPRIIAMIINEAYFALGENVSTKKEIDTAMRLGTNYPFGPFEWSDIIGLNEIYNLLKILSEDDERYEPAPLLIKEAGG